MKSRLRCRWFPRVEVGSAAAILAVLITPARACGPNFPNSYLAATDESLLAAPEGSFAAEIAHLAADLPVAHHAVPAESGAAPNRQRAIEADQLAEALRAAGCDATEAKARISALGSWRDALDAWWTLAPAKRAATPAPAAPVGVPAEFVLYTRGAVAWRHHAAPVAQDAWTELLALPEAQRRHRTIWVAYMFGREAGGEVGSASTRPTTEALAEARRWFRLVRDLAASGWPDPLGLAAESYGWEARAALDGGNPAEAAKLYLQQYATGDASASASLRITTRRLIEPTPDESAVLDPALRPLMIAYVVSHVGASLFEDEPERSFARWAEALASALEKAGLGDIAESDRLAWLAYEGGRFELAERWAKLAPEAAPMGRWIRAKLALRAGNTREGARLLGLVAVDPQLDPALRARADAELGRFRLALGDFPGALGAWLRGGHWQDAAYVAERLMTTDELEAFVGGAAMPPTPPKPPPGTPESGWYRSGYWWLPDHLGVALRHLLGRRLARAGKVEEAEPFFPEELRPLVRRYGADVRTGFDAERPAAERAAAFWRAAQTAREHGLELLGTELEPDWFIWGAQYTTDDAEKLRRETPAAGGVFAAQEEERKRLERHPAPAKRFYYRYRAAELAGWAAALLPNDSEQTAEILDTAGRWLMQRDPEAANPFYQLLVVRCPHTKLGRRAAIYHWFPDPSDSGAEDDCTCGDGDEE